MVWLPFLLRCFDRYCRSLFAAGLVDLDGMHKFLVYLAEAVLGRGAAPRDVSARVHAWAGALYSRTVTADAELDALLQPDTIKLMQLFVVPLQKVERRAYLGWLVALAISHWFLYSCIAALWRTATRR